MFQLSAFILLLAFWQCPAANMPAQKDFQMSQFKGQWYGIAASSNCPMFKDMKKDMTLPIIVYGMDKDNVKVAIAFKTPKGCQQMDFKYDTISSGHYKHSSPHGDNEVVIVGTDYKAFALEYTETMHEGKTCTTLKLYGRETNLPMEIKQQFMAYAKNLGLTEDDTKVFSKGDLCPPHV
ncbi:olfactory protein-like [Pseudophryne corroboree]|uniref:olfactory protein-like n=1 Tax=Pseudophryne corroboree TaxID=495146 RepID=UPI0030816E24